MQKYLKILFLFISVCAYGQKPLHLSVEVLGKDAEFIKKNISYSTILTDSVSLNRQLNNILIRCNELSFLLTEFTSINIINDTCYAKLKSGKSFRWVKLKKGNVPLDILNIAGFREEQFYDKQFDPIQFSKRAERILITMENNGYPFASVKLDSILFDSNGISASINLDKGNLIYFDSLELRGDATIKKWYLEKYLNIKKGNTYNELLIKNTDSRLSQLPFIKTTRTSSIYFFGNKARPILFIDNRKASSVDGIIGFAPGNQQNNQIKITGEANLKLQNILGSGKSIDLNYRSFQTSSQDLQFKFQWPYIFRSSLALDYNLALLKYDSLYLDVKNEIGLQYRFIGTDYFKIYYSIQTTSLITIDTNLIKQTQTLPQNSDIRIDQYGIGFRKSKYDYYLNPTKGYNIEFSAGVGIKNILKNNTIQNVNLIDSNGNPYSVYDKIKLEYIQYKLTINADYFLKLLNRTILHTQLNGAHIESENIFFNELYRIGGIRTLKGFDEQSIFASSYTIINTELRYLLQQNSNFILFWNGAWYKNVNQNKSDKPYGFGAGLNFETGAGIFSLFYAVGSQSGSSIDFSKAKIHFGFVNYF
ncbi:MAG: hypothetical protein WCO54_02975 [Bacteroidota bacterium]